MTPEEIAKFTQDVFVYIHNCIECGTHSEITTPTNKGEYVAIYCPFCGE